MIGKRLGVAVCILTGFVAALVWAQSPSAGDAPLTVAGLRARVKTLEEENARLRRDYELILTTCQSRTDTNPAPATSATRLLGECAAATAGETQLAEANRLGQQQERPRIEDDPGEVASVDYAIIESNKIFISYVWTLTISNGLDRAQAFNVTLHFLDGNGSIIDTDREDNEMLDAHEQRTLTGSYVIPMPGALNVASVRAVAKRTR
jgi:hypothetical protein